MSFSIQSTIYITYNINNNNIQWVTFKHYMYVLGIEREHLLVSQWSPVKPLGHVQRYPLTDKFRQVPSFKHGDDSHTSGDEYIKYIYISFEHTHLHSHANKHIFTHAYTHTYTLTYTHTYTLTFTHTYTHTYTLTCTLTYTHTYRLTDSCSLSLTNKHTYKGHPISVVTWSPIWLLSHLFITIMNIQLL